jgi:hypothetical protein
MCVWEGARSPPPPRGEHGGPRGARALPRARGRGGGTHEPPSGSALPQVPWRPCRVQGDQNSRPKRCVRTRGGVQRGALVLWVHLVDVAAGALGEHPHARDVARRRRGVQRRRRGEADRQATRGCGRLAQQAGQGVGHGCGRRRWRQRWAAARAAPRRAAPLPRGARARAGPAGPARVPLAAARDPALRRSARTAGLRAACLLRRRAAAAPPARGDRAALRVGSRGASGLFAADSTLRLGELYAARGRVAEALAGADLSGSFLRAPRPFPGAKAARSRLRAVPAPPRGPGRPAAARRGRRRGVAARGRRPPPAPPRRQGPPPKRAASPGLLERVGVPGSAAK